MTRTYLPIAIRGMPPVNRLWHAQTILEIHYTFSQWLVAGITLPMFTNKDSVSGTHCIWFYFIKQLVRQKRSGRKRSIIVS